MDRVCHFEVPYSDKARMESFYSRVFGWQFMQAPGEMPYTFIITTELDETHTPKRPGGINEEAIHVVMRVGPIRPSS